jgi:hypothetical protein
MNRFEIYLIATPHYWYVGSTTIGSNKRFERHMAGQSNAPILWKKIQTLGSDAFHLTVLEQGRGDPIEAERRWYDWYIANDSRQTLNGKRPNTWGVAMTPAVREKIAEAHRGTKHSMRSRHRMRDAHLGKPLSAEHIARISEGHKAVAVKEHTMRMECECGIVSTPSGIARHIKASGHDKLPPGKKKDAALARLRTHA